MTINLDYTPPYDWPAMIGFFAARAIAGVETVEPNRYARTIEIDSVAGTIEVAPAKGRPALAATVCFPNDKAVPEIVGRIRRVFGLDVDIQRITAQLARDETLAPLVAARPGLRVPGAWDQFELAIRAILGQQITVAAARHLAGKLTAQYGRRTEPGDPTLPGLTTLFPRAETLAAADLSTLGMPRSRVRTLSTLAAACPGLFDDGQDVERTVTNLKALPGIGEWTAQYIAIRALRDPDAFPAADIGLLRAMTPPGGTRPSAAALLARAEAWRPWRAYAAQHLWTSDPKAPVSSNGSPSR